MTFMREAILVAALALYAPVALAGEVFRCVVVESRHLSDDGKQASYPRDIYAGETIIADTKSGLVRLFGNAFQFEIAQTGSKDNGWVLTRREHGTGSTAVNLLAIQIYRPSVPFVLADGMMTYSGNCNPIR